MPLCLHVCVSVFLCVLSYYVLILVVTLVGGKALRLGDDPNRSLWEMESTSVIQQSRPPKDESPITRRDSLVTEVGDKPPDPTTLKPILRWPSPNGAPKRLAKTLRPPYPRDRLPEREKRLVALSWGEKKGFGPLGRRRLPSPTEALKLQAKHKLGVLPIGDLERSGLVVKRGGFPISPLHEPEL